MLGCEDKVKEGARGHTAFSSLLVGAILGGGTMLPWPLPSLLLPLVVVVLVVPPGGDELAAHVEHCVSSLQGWREAAEVVVSGGGGGGWWRGL